MNLVYLLVGVFVRLQRLHDGEFCVVFEPPGLLAQNLPQHPQSQRSDHVLGELQTFECKGKGAIAWPICSVMAEMKRACVPLCRPSFRAAAAGWSWNVRPTPAGCFRESASAVRTVLPSSPQCARCDWTTLSAARPPALIGPGCDLLRDKRIQIRYIYHICVVQCACVFSVRMCLCTIGELLRVIHAGVFATVFEGRVWEVLAGTPGAGGEQGGVEEGSLVVQSHAASVHQVWHSAIYPAVPLQRCNINCYSNQTFVDSMLFSRCNKNNPVLGLVKADTWWTTRGEAEQGEEVSGALVSVYIYPQTTKWRYLSLMS